MLCLLHSRIKYIKCNDVVFFFLISKTHCDLFIHFLLQIIIDIVIKRKESKRQNNTVLMRDFNTTEIGKNISFVTTRLTRAHVENKSKP